MKKTFGTRLARKMLPYVATILSASLAVTLRIERVCSGVPTPYPELPPRVLYAYPEILSPISFTF